MIQFDLSAGGRTYSYRQRVAEPEPGRVLREVDIDAPRRTTFTVTPAGEKTHVLFETTWRASGLRGLVERLLAPRLLQPLYRDELNRLEAYAGNLAHLEAEHRSGQFL